MSTIQGTFNTAVQAMLTQSQELSNISTNIANVNTTGYKEQDSHFQTILNEVQGDGSNFFAVQGIDNRNVTKLGTIATTNRNLDVAINGQGFFVTNTNAAGTGTWEYTRDGSFVGQAVTLPTSTNGVPDQGTLLTTETGQYVYGWAADANGNFPNTNDLTTLQPIVYSNDSTSPSKETSNIQIQANVAAGISTRQSIGVPFIDAAGTTRTLTIGFNSTGGSNYTLDMSSVDNTTNQPVEVDFNPPNVSFDSTGKLTTPSGGIVTATVDDASGPQTITVDLSKVTQFGGDSNITVQNINQDGYIAGSLSSTYFTSSGVLVGSYSNGQVKNLYQLPVAMFASPDNLTALPGTNFMQSAASGDVQLTTAGSPANSTQFVDGALETSNVDLADQFSKMIVTQRAYSSAAEVVKTADQMTQAARDLVQ